MAPPSGGSAVLAAALLLAASASAQATCAVGVDHPNGDFPGMPLPMPVNDTAACAAACAADPQCVIFAFIAPGCVSNVAPLCYLKSTATAATQATPCHCSGAPVRASGAVPANAAAFTISAPGVTATVGAYGLTGFTSSPSRRLPGAPAAISHAVALDSWVVVVGSVLVNSSSLPPPAVARQLSPSSAELTFVDVAGAGSGVNVTVTYTAVGEGTGLGYVGFLRKAVAITASAPVVVTSVSPWDALLLTPASGAAVTAATYPSGELGGYGVFARLSDGTGVLAAAENPFLYSLATPVISPSTGVLVHVGYHPLQRWAANSSAIGGPAGAVYYAADAGVLAAYALRNTPVAQPAAAAADDHDEALVVVPLPMTRTRAAHGALGADAPALSLRQHVFGAPAATAAAAPSLDVAERDAFRGVAEGSLLLPADAPLTVHIPWTENDYQIQVNNASQWPEYQRILDRLQSLGIAHILYAGSNSAVATPANNTDAWGWEQTLWLNMGQRIRMDLWLPGRDAVPPSVAGLASAAATAGVHLLPYVYPILAFSENPGWLYPINGGKASQARLSDPDLQDFLVSTLVNLSAVVPGGLGGAGFDYTYFDEPDTTVLSQWYGWRRVLRGVRTALAASTGALPVVDNRQANHAWSPWMWAAGSYAEPLQGDEGPYSWEAYVRDPHTDRQSANHQREISYLYAQSMFCPPGALPGFMQHQTDRFNGTSGGIPETDFLVRDYDFYGAAYGILSSIATGPANNVVCGLPARDAGEFVAFPATSEASGGVDVSVAFYRSWFEWAAANYGTLRNVKPLPVPPAPGVTDGTFAFNGSAGFVFLFNPNTAALPSPPLALDASLDLLCAVGSTYALTELYPVPGRVLTTAPCGSGNITLQLEGRSATVVVVAPVAPGASPLLVGRAARKAGDAAVTVAAAVASATTITLPDGAWADVHWRTDPAYVACAAAPLYVVLPAGGAHHALAAGGVTVAIGSTGRRVAAAVAKPGEVAAAGFDASACPPGTPHPPVVGDNDALVVPVWFSPPAGTTFVHSAPVAGLGPNPGFTGGTLNGTVAVPSAVFAQLAARNASYPVPYTPDDAAIAWLVPGRLVAYIDVGKALGPGAAVTATLGGAPLPVRPVWSCRSLLRSDCFSGYWLDLTAAGVAPDTPTPITVTLPALPAGSFAGVYYDNVNTIASSEVE